MTQVWNLIPDNVVNATSLGRFVSENEKCKGETCPPRISKT